MTRRTLRVPGRGLLAATVFGTLLAGRPAASLAQSVCGARDADAGDLVVSRRTWPAPLDRRIALHATNVALRDALDRLGAAAGFKLSYSGDLLPLDRRVCIAHEAIAAGDALLELLRGTATEPVITAADRVVLAPARALVATEPVAARGIGILERVVVTGSVTPAPERGLTVALDIVDGEDLARRDRRSLSDIIDGSVPGLWLWAQSPASPLARYGSTRGASSFDLSYPKMYIDGIEVANPLLVSQLNPDAIARIEIIRGPQGAALYGADAISGVINVVTRRHPGAGGERMSVRASAGLVRSEYATSPVVVQQHDLALRLGSPGRSAQLAVSAGTVGDFLPRSDSRELAIDAGTRLVGSRLSLTTTAHLYARNAGVPIDPLVPSLTAPPAPTATRLRGASHTRSDSGPAGSGSGSSDSLPGFASSGPQTVRQFTLGATGTFTPSEQWTHRIVAGVDGYRLGNVPNDFAPVRSSTDSALLAASGGADRYTVRASSVGQFGAPERVASTLSFSIEHSMLDDRSAAALPLPGRDGDGGGSGRQGGPRGDDGIARWRSTSGVVAQANSALHDALFFTGGLRLERSDTFLGVSRFDLLPMVGAAAVLDVGPLTAKLRGGYGRGIRTPQTAPRMTRRLSSHDGSRSSLAASLDPEVQDGTELGFDLLAGRGASLHVTRFDQRAHGLIQAVTVAIDTSDHSGSRHSPPLMLQNVGAITNRGWELQGTAVVGALELSGAVTFVDSRVQRLAAGYTGDLRPGDRMLGVPARTASAVASFARPRWSASVSAARAFDWIAYDRLRIVTDANASADLNGLVGDLLRNYWRDYDGATRLGASVTRDLLGGIALTAAGENLLNNQRGEPDNLTVVPGRTLIVGLRARF